MYNGSIVSVAAVMPGAAGGELKRAGLATHLVPSESLPQVEVALRAGGAAHRDPAAVAATLASFEVAHCHILMLHQTFVQGLAWDGCDWTMVRCSSGLHAS